MVGRRIASLLGRNATAARSREQPSRSRRHRLAVVFVQFDRLRYPDSLSRVIGVVDRLKRADSTIVVVDNRQPGDWVHEVSARLIHVGGDNSAWEFSAFDLGIRFLKARSVSADIFAFVTDALLAYGDDFLELIDDRALDACASAQACVGWVDSLPEAFEVADHAHRGHLRSSFLLMPSSVVTRMAPLTTPLDAARIFGPSAREPFRAEAPISNSVKTFLLDWLTTGRNVPATGERWHSAFELEDATFELFRAKALAILRELSLSARLAAAQVPCFDLRLVRQLAATGLTLTERLATSVREWQWDNWKRGRVLALPRFHTVDVCRIPASVAHGGSASISFEGWVATAPQVTEVELALGDKVYRAPCDIARPDVVAAHPEIRDERVGFRFSLDLDTLPPGVHEAVWRVPGTALAQAIGRVRVLPSITFEVGRWWIPDTPGSDGEVPFAIEGTVVSTMPLASVGLRWDGAEMPASCTEGEERVDISRQRRKHLLVAGTLPSPAEPRGHALELWLESETGETTVWRHAVHIQASKPAGPYSLSVREIGPFDPETATTRIRLRGVVLARRGDVLALLRDGHAIVEEELRLPVGTEGRSAASFDVQREVPTLPPGPSALSLVVRGVDATEREMVTWAETVRLLHPVLHLDVVEVQPGPSVSAPYLLRLGGWVENDFLVSFVTVAVDGVAIGRFDLDIARPDVALATGKGLVTRQGFHNEIAFRANPGRHELALTAIQGNGEEMVWRQPLDLDPHAEQAFALDSEDLASLRRTGPKTFWSSFTARGQMRSSLANVRASLSVDGVPVDERSLSGNQDFTLRHAPRNAGEHTVRVRFDTRDRLLFDSGLAKVAIRPLAVPAWAGKALEELLKELRPGRSLDHGFSSEEIIRRLLEERPEGASQLLSLLARTRKRVGAPRRSALAAGDLPALDGPRLSVLVASWQVPASRHGGGVYLSNLLKDLGQRHRVTLVHAFDPDETGWDAEIRPFVSDVISVPRGGTRSIHRREPWIPLRYEECYTPALRRAIECEIATGGYDLVDYEYTAMLPHYEHADVPRVQAILELAHLAVVASWNSRADVSSRDQAVDQIVELLEAYYWDTIVLPSAARHLVTVTPEDGDALARGQDEADVYVNPIPVDAERLAPPAAGEGTRNTLVFLGNFLHRPNVEAAEFLVTKVMPRIRTRNPDARLVIIGSNVPVELERRAAGRVDVEFTGFLDDFRPALWRAGAFLAPIFTGAGMRVKVAEAMACACPLISSRLGVNGLEAEAGVHYVNAEDADGFADAACQLLADRPRAESLGAAARRLMIDRHGTRRRAAERELIWRRAVSLHGSQSAAASDNRPRPS